MSIMQQAYSYNNNLDYDFENEFKVIKGKKQDEKNITKKVAIKNNKLALVLTTLSVFLMVVTLSYRYNLISEKNLELQRLNNTEVTTKAALLETEVRVSQNLDMDYVEAYAKQQLGMQKPEKSQMIYISTDYESKVETKNEDNVIQKTINKIKNSINNVLN